MFVTEQREMKSSTNKVNPQLCTFDTSECSGWKILISSFLFRVAKITKYNFILKTIHPEIEMQTVVGIANDVIAVAVPPSKR